MTKDTTKINWRYVKMAAGVAGLFLSPFFSYMMFEYVTGNLMKIPVEMALLNVTWMYAVYLLMFGISGNSRVTIPASTFLLFAISVAETFVVSFRGRPILVSELLALGTALSVAENYSFDVTKQMAAAAFAILVWNILLWQIPVRLKNWKFRGVNAAACLTAVCLGVYGFYKVTIPNMGLYVNQWSVNDSYDENGFILSTAVSLQYMVKSAPKGYSTAYLNGIYEEMSERIEQRDQAEEVIQPVNIICIMNESLAELKVAGDYETNIPYFPYMESLRTNTVKGSLCVPVFGSLTSNTEYEFLTGDSMALLPVNSIAYQFYVNPDTRSLVSTVKNQGYETIAMHPYPAENWNRRESYQHMGFDQFLAEEYYVGSEELRNYVSDQADYEKIIELVEQKESSDDRLFVFNVTMQNHGGYDYEFENFKQEVWLTGDLEGKYPKADQYLSLMKRSDDALQYLLEYFENSDEPTMIVMFGDHQPGVEDEFYDDIAGIVNAEVEHFERLMWYQTPFIIWTNYEQESKDLGKLSALFLGSEVLELANLEITPYDEFLLGLAKDVPVVHFLGCYDPEDKFYPWGDAQNGGHPFSSLLQDYEMLVYNHSLDTHEMQKLYSLKD